MGPKGPQPKQSYGIQAWYQGGSTSGKVPGGSKCGGKGGFYHKNEAGGGIPIDAGLLQSSLFERSRVSESVTTIKAALSQWLWSFVLQIQQLKFTDHSG